MFETNISITFWESFVNLASDKWCLSGMVQLVKYTCKRYWFSSRSRTSGLYCEKKSVAFTLQVFHMNMPKGALQWSVYAQAAARKHISAPLATASMRSMFAGTHVTDLGRMESWMNFSGKGHTDIKPLKWLTRPWTWDLGPLGWEAEIFPLRHPSAITMNCVKTVNRALVLSFWGAIPLMEVLFTSVNHR